MENKEISDIDKVLKTSEEVGAKKENLRISKAFSEVHPTAFSMAQWDIIRKILVTNK